MSSPSETEIAWLAGLLEGEGCFARYQKRTGRGRPYLRLYLKMTDEDVVSAALAIINSLHPTKSRVHPIADKRPNKSMCFQLQIGGHTSEAVMRTIRPYMKSRRGAAIDELLAFRGYSHHPKTTSP